MTIVLCNTDNGLGLYCTECEQPLDGYPDQMTDLTVHYWPGLATLEEANRYAEQHYAEAHR